MDKTCTLLLLRRNGEILLALKKRGFGPGMWNGVGGKLDPGETVEQAMIRECQEEIEVTPTTYDKVAEFTFHMDVDTSEPWDLHVHTYVATEWEGEPVETEEMAPQWYKLADIPYDKMWDDDTYWLPAVLRGQKLRGEFDTSSKNVMLSAHLTPVASLE